MELGPPSRVFFFLGTSLNTPMDVVNVQETFTLPWAARPNQTKFPLSPTELTVSHLHSVQDGYMKGMKARDAIRGVLGQFNAHCSTIQVLRSKAHASHFFAK